MLEYTIINKIPITDLIEDFIQRGGRIHKHYLRTPLMKGPSLVYLNGWFSGHNLQAAILKAIAQK